MLADLQSFPPLSSSQPTLPKIKILQRPPAPPAPAPEIAALYAQARQASADHEVTFFMDEEAVALEKAERVRSHIDQFVEAMTSLEKLQPLIDEAASHGLFETTLLTFRGGDTFGGEDGLCILFLLVGSRHAETIEELSAFGVTEFALQKLKKKLKPFKVDHTYDAMTNENELKLSWK